MRRVSQMPQALCADVSSNASMANRCFAPNRRSTSAAAEGRGLLDVRSMEGQAALCASHNCLIRANALGQASFMSCSNSGVTSRSTTIFVPSGTATNV